VLDSENDSLMTFDHPWSLYVDCTWLDMPCEADFGFSSQPTGLTSVTLFLMCSTCGLVKARRVPDMDTLSLITFDAPGPAETCSIFKSRESWLHRNGPLLHLLYSMLISASKHGRQRGLCGAFSNDEI